MEENKKYRILGTLLYYMLRIISSTLKIEIINKYGIDMQKPHIYGFWHSKLFITPIFFKDVEKKLAMSSPTKDGELISVPLEKMGYVLVRGSSDKNQISSTISLLKYLKKGYSIGTPLDGPKGPKEKAKKGLLYLSQKTSIPLVPVGISYSKKWILKKTWDKFEIPKPFSKVKIFLSEPITISDKDDLDKITHDTTIEELKDIINNYDLTKIEKLWLMEYIDLLPERVKELTYDDIMELTDYSFTFRGNKKKNVIADIAKINSNVDDYIKVISEHLYYLIDNAEDIYKHYASVYRKDNLPDTVLRLIVINNTHCNYKDSDGKNIHVDGGEWVKVYPHLTEFIMEFLKKKFYK